jgi:hypothetical protein
MRNKHAFFLGPSIFENRGRISKFQTHKLKKRENIGVAGAIGRILSPSSRFYLDEIMGY